MFNSTKAAAAATLLCLAIGGAIFAFRQPRADDKANPPPPSLAPSANTGLPAAATIDVKPHLRFQQQLRQLLHDQRDPRATAMLLRALHAEDPQALFEVLLSLRDAPLHVRRDLVPVLGAALIQWPDVEGRYVTPIADLYGDLDLPASARWAADFLSSTQRDDLAALTLIGRLGENSEADAIALLSRLPGRARDDAIASLADHLVLSDLDHLARLSAQIDPEGKTHFSSRLFNRLAMERLDDTADWLSRDPMASRIPGAAETLGTAMVTAGNPQRAIAWADALPDKTARGSAISAVYRRWAHLSPEAAIQDIFKAYPDDPQLVASVFSGAADHHASGPAAHWETATSLPNPTARIHATASLIEPMLSKLGLPETQARIALLSPGSPERTSAETTLEAAIKKPHLARLLAVMQQNQSLE